MKIIPKCFSRLFSAIADVSRRLAVQRDGNVLVLFAMASIPVIIAAGIAIDSARAYMIKQRLGSALDAAALAVGSQSITATSAQLTTDLNNYFYDNYCKKVPTGGSVTSCTSTVATEYNLSVQATTTITNATVTYSASATVPTTFMRLVGINSLPVTATAQTTKFPGMEIAVVLDKTGSMLCGPNDNAPAYSDTACAVGVVTGDTSCTNSSNQSRICTLINAANQFVTTLQAAITAPQSIYMSIVPYVTTVNVGNALCSSSTSCTRITTDAPSGDFADLRGNIMPVIPITGTTTSGSTSVSSASFYSTQGPGYVSGTAPILAGMTVYGHGIGTAATPYATISSASGSSITLSSNAALTYTANSMAVGPPIASTNVSQPYTDPTTYTATAKLTAGSTAVTLSTGTTTNNIVAGMVVTGTGLSASTTFTVATVVNATSITLSSGATTTEGSPVTLTFSLAGSATSGSTTISSLKGTTTSLNSIVVGMGISGTGIPANAYVTSTTGSPPTSLTISAATTSTKAGDIVTLTNLGATTTTGNTQIRNVSQLGEASSPTTAVTPHVGDVIVGNGIPANTTVVSTGGTFSSNTGTITLSNAATTPSNFSSATGTCCNTALVDVPAMTYDSTFNTTNATTTNWGGCVIEPTSSDEMSATSTTGSLISTLSDPDVSAPSSSESWYPYYWTSNSGNSWPTIDAQNTSTETQGTVVGTYDQLNGPNAGCPVPMLPLTDLTSTAGQTAITNTINSMWPKDSSGTQVPIGMIWGWRVLDPNGPFTANNGHPLSYSEASSTGWKKIIVLMTDGTEEWPEATDYTGLGFVTDGKIGTNSNVTTAVTNVGTRLSTLCTNAASDGIIIYTIGLGSDGASNTSLQSCPANGGFFRSATPTNLAGVFNSIAESIIHLRLTQ